MPVAQSKIYSVRIVEPILGALGIDHFCMEGPDDVAMLPPAIDRAYARSLPLVLSGRTQGEPMMRRDECLKILDKHRGDDAIAVCVYNAAFDWRADFAKSAQLLSRSARWGRLVARARHCARHARHKVIVLDGDGSLLMNLGSLVTVARPRRRNYSHFVCENGDYEANGGHPIPPAAR